MIAETHVILSTELKDRQGPASSQSLGKHAVGRADCCTGTTTCTSQEILQQFQQSGNFFRLPGPVLRVKSMKAVTFLHIGESGDVDTRVGTVNGASVKQNKIAWICS